MSGAGCPPVHVTSDVTAAYLSTSGKAPTTERQQSLGHYARTDDVSDVLLGAGNDYFHQHRRHQFREVAAARHQQAMMTAPRDLAGTCHAEVEHIYESPNHDGPPSSLSMTDRQREDSYYSENDSRLTTS